MKKNDNHTGTPITAVEARERGEAKKEGPHAQKLLQDEISSYLVRAWYEYHGSPYGETDRGLMRWTQEQLDRLHSASQ
jgi:hypothetical protein